jgi:hypothetical protein
LQSTISLASIVHLLYELSKIASPSIESRTGNFLLHHDGTSSYRVEGNSSRSEFSDPKKETKIIAVAREMSLNVK